MKECVDKSDLELCEYHLPRTCISGLDGEKLGQPFFEQDLQILVARCLMLMSPC